MDNDIFGLAADLTKRVSPASVANIGKSAKFVPSHPTITGMAIGGTIALAHSLMRPLHNGSTAPRPILGQIPQPHEAPNTAGLQNQPTTYIQRNGAGYENPRHKRHRGIFPPTHLPRTYMPDLNERYNVTKLTRPDNSVISDKDLAGII